jgi:hypothetical protein
MAMRDRQLSPLKNLYLMIQFTELGSVRVEFKAILI